MVLPRNPNISSASIVLLMMVSGGSTGLFSEVHYHLHCFECVKLQVVMTALGSQIFISPRSTEKLQDIRSVGKLKTIHPHFITSIHTYPVICIYIYIYIYIFEATIMMNQLLINQTKWCHILSSLFVEHK